MINYKDKPLESLNMEETIEFEKQMLKKVLAASKAQMGDGLLDQINLFIALIRDHKQQIIQTAMQKTDKIDGTVLEIGSIALPDEVGEPGEIVKDILDFYGKE